MTDGDCWACRAELRHDERSATECPHALSDGSPRPCCCDEIALHVELTGLLFLIKTGRVAVPDTPAALVRDHGERN